MKIDKSTPLRTAPYQGPYRSIDGVCRIPVWDGWLRCYRWALVDEADYGTAMRRRWRADGNGYPCTSVYNKDAGTSHSLYLHRMIARAPANMQADHRWHDKTDCRRRALRVATPSENSANTRRFLTDKLSPFRGVTRHRCGKWQAQLKHGDTNHYLGLFDSAEDAARAYNTRARATWGRFAQLNAVPGQSRRTARERAS